MKAGQAYKKELAIFSAIVALLFLNYVNPPDRSTKLRSSKIDSLALGIIADCQYANVKTSGVRHYAISDQKLKDCVIQFNSLELDHVFHLGDFIDRDERSFDTVLPIISGLKSNSTLVLGNHDFSVADQFKEQVPGLMGLKERYFSLHMKGWKFLILDGNDVSLYAWPKGSKKGLEAHNIHQEKYANLPTYNGALGAAQMEWLKDELVQSEQDDENVILLCHFPVLPADPHVLWNSEEVVELISSYSCVKAWLNGHNHAGDYAQYQGIHFVTFKGMVDTPDNSYAIVTLTDRQLTITGFGREGDRILSLRQN